MTLVTGRPLSTAGWKVSNLTYLQQQLSDIHILTVYVHCKYVHCAQGLLSWCMLGVSVLTTVKAKNGASSMKSNCQFAAGKEPIPFACGTIHQSIDPITSNTPLSKNLVSHLLVNGLKSS